MRSKLAMVVGLAACSLSACESADGDLEWPSDEPTEAEIASSPERVNEALGHEGCIGVDVDAPRTLGRLAHLGEMLVADIQSSAAVGDTELVLVAEVHGHEIESRTLPRTDASAAAPIELARIGELGLPEDEVVHLTLREVDGVGIARPVDTHGFYAFGGELYTEAEWQARSLDELNAERIAMGELPVDMEVTNMGFVDLDAETANDDGWLSDEVALEEEDSDEDR